MNQQAERQRETISSLIARKMRNSLLTAVWGRFLYCGWRNGGMWYSQITQRQQTDVQQQWQQNVLQRIRNKVP